MKSLKLFAGFIVITTLALFSCSKSNTPVSQIVEILDQATERAENINNESELTDINNIISPEAIADIVNNNADYELTKGDKESLKKSYNKLVKTVYEKSSEYVPSEDMKKMVKSQMDLMLEAVNQNIDKATTLGSITGLQ